jgi:glycosyltransferase involved in cell wall biosynthesis
MECLGWKSSFDRSLTCRIEDAVVIRSDLVTCSTKSHANIISQKTGIDPEKVALIPLGTELPDLNIVRSTSGSEPPFPKPMVLFIGRIERRKGIHTLIEAIPAIMREISGVHFVIIGRDTYVDDDVVSFQGSDRNSFKSALIRKLPEECKKNVHFLGYVDPELIPRYMYHCDVFAAPSLYESFGQVYIEAMSYEKPVVGCRTGGVPEVVEDKKTGLLVDTDNPAQLADAIISLLKDKDYAIAMGIAGRRSVEEKFTRKKMAERTLKAYETVLNKRIL